MATTAEKLASSKPAPLHRVETDHGNLHRSKDEFEAKVRADKAIRAKLELEKARLEEEAANEMAALEKAGKEEQNAPNKEASAEE